MRLLGATDPVLPQRYPGAAMRRRGRWWDPPWPTVATFGSRVVIDQICRYFGGPYDPATHTYRTPAVAGLGAVRRGWAKAQDFADYTAGMPPGTMTGCQLIVQIPRGRDHRVALPAILGRREVHYTVELYGFVWSKALYAEDTLDFSLTLIDAIKARLRMDPTLGTGGIEAGGFQVGEGTPGGDGEVSYQYEQPKSVGGDTKLYFLITFTATAYDVA